MSSATFDSIVSKLAGTSWMASEELVGGVSTAVLVRRCERLVGDSEKVASPVTVVFPEGVSAGVSGADSGVSRDNVLEKVVTLRDDEASITRQSSVRPYCPLGAQKWPGRTAAATSERLLAEDITAHGPSSSSDGLSWVSSVAAVEAGLGPLDEDDLDLDAFAEDAIGGGGSGGSEGSGAGAVTVAGEPEVRFGDLPTVRAMGSGRSRTVIGFDTEFVYETGDDGESVRRILSYQFSLIDPRGSAYRYDIVLMPLVAGERLGVEACLSVISRVAGLWEIAGLPDPRGVARRDFWASQGEVEEERAARGRASAYGVSMNKLARFGTIKIVLAGHFLKADLTAFASPGPRARYEDILRRVRSASGGLISIQPIRMVARSGAKGSGERYLPFSIIVRDTMGHAAPGMKSLAVLGKSVGIPKIEVSESWKSRMDEYAEQHLPEFLDYSANDAVIVFEYLAAVWGENVVPPATLSGGGARALKDSVMSYWLLGSTAEFMARFQGLMKVKTGQDVESDGLGYYTELGLAPIDGDANQVHSACSRAFHGGWNASLMIGQINAPTFDHDIQSAYPSAMGVILDIDYETGAIEEVLKDRPLTEDDFPMGFSTPLVAYVSWSFPGDVEPCIPVKVESSIVYPMSSEGIINTLGELPETFRGRDGAWVMAPELLLALKLGARVEVQIGYRLRVLVLDGQPSRSLRHAVRQMVRDRGTAKRVFGKKSLEELIIKVATNSCYGKLAQDIARRMGWNAWDQESEEIGGSSITSPYHASMITSLVRALLLAVANEIEILSVTTDGFISEVEDIESLEAFGLAEVFRESREALTGDRSLWEVKHRQDAVLNLTTRGNVALTDGGVLAKAGLKTPSQIERGSLEERRWFRDLTATRTGKIGNPHTVFPSHRELSAVGAKRRDFVPKDVCPEVSVDFDMKRRPVWELMRAELVEIDGVDYEIATFPTVPWNTVDEYLSAKNRARYAAAYRPGTVGPNRPTGALRTVDEWSLLRARIESNGLKVRSDGGVILQRIVAAHRLGFATVPMLDAKVSVNEKLVWLSSLGFGEITRSQWDHLTKADRLSRVGRTLKDAVWLETLEVIENLPPPPRGEGTPKSPSAGWAPAPPLMEGTPS